jgi:hypothetical protein
MKKFLVLLLFPLVASAHAGAKEDSVTWEIPTARVDEQPLPIEEIAHIELEVTKDAVVIHTQNFPPTVTTFVYERELPPDYTLCYRARTVDTDGLESDWTEQVCKTVKGQPNPPPGLGVK